MEKLHGFADLSPLRPQIFSPLWPKRVYFPLNLDVPIEEITALLLKGYFFQTL